MDLDSLDDDDAQQLAARIGPHLDPGSYGDRVVLTKRQVMGLATGTLGTGALLSLGVDDAAAQAAGSQGTASSPNNMYAYDLNVENAVTSALPMNGNDIENAGSVSTNAIDTDNGGSGLSYQDVTASRSFDTWEQAPSDRDIWFMASAVATSADTDVRLFPVVNSTQTDQIIQRKQYRNELTLGVDDEISTALIRVPAGHYYKIISQGVRSDFDLSIWFELR